MNLSVGNHGNILNLFQFFFLIFSFFQDFLIHTALCVLANTLNKPKLSRVHCSQFGTKHWYCPWHCPTIYKMHLKFTSQSLTMIPQIQTTFWVNSVFLSQAYPTKCWTCLSGTTCTALILLPPRVQFSPASNCKKQKNFFSQFLEFLRKNLILFQFQI